MSPAVIAPLWTANRPPPQRCAAQRHPDARYRCRLARNEAQTKIPLATRFQTAPVDNHLNSARSYNPSRHSQDRLESLKFLPLDWPERRTLHASVQSPLLYVFRYLAEHIPPATIRPFVEKGLGPLHERVMSRWRVWQRQQ